MENKIKLISREDWIKHQICGDFPEVDPKCLAFCCSPVKRCPYRDATLSKLGWDIIDYTTYKATLGSAVFSIRPEKYFPMLLPDFSKKETGLTKTKNKLKYILRWLKKQNFFCVKKEKQTGIGKENEKETALKEKREENY